jgi:hypothetical protein
MRIRRPWTKLAVAALAGHAFFELAAGVGMPSASLIGPLPAASVWWWTSAWAWRAAGRRGRAPERGLALYNGMALAGAVAHFLAWPRRRRLGLLPWLRQCEGLGPSLMRWYNPILYASLVAGAAALAVENRSARRLGWSMLALAPLLVPVQHAEHRRMRAMAAAQPAWWNRRLAPVAPRDVLGSADGAQRGAPALI